METVGILLDAGGADKYLSTLAQVAAAETKVASAADPAVAAINRLDDAASATAADAILLSKSADKAAAEVDDLGDAAKKGGKEVDDLGEDAEKSSKGLSVLDRIAKGASERIGHLLTDAAAQAGQAIVRFIGDSIDAAGDFEAGMNNFAATAGDSLAESGQSVEDFKDLFLSLGRELPVSTAEVQQAAIEMAKGGIEPATIAAGGLRQTLQFAAASGLGLAESAEIAAKAVGGWTAVNATAAQKADFLAYSTDLMARAANAATVNVDDLALGLFNAQGSAKAAGADFDEVVTTLAATATSFSSSAQAGTGLANFMNRLQPQTVAASDAFKRLNLLTAEGKSVFYDAQGSFIGMSEAAGILQTATQDLSEAERAEVMQTIFGNDAKNTAVKLAELGAAGFDDMTVAMAKQLSVSALAERKQQGFNAAMDNLLGSLEALQITVMSAALPALSSLVSSVSAGINAITAYAEATGKGGTALAKIASVVSDTFVPALGGATAALTAYAVVQTTRAIPAILASLPAIAAQTTALVANAAASLAAIAPYALIAAAVGATVYAWQQYSQAIDDATQQLLEGKVWWNESAMALENFATKTDESRAALEPYATTIDTLRSAIEADTRALGDHEAAYATFGAASGYTREQLDKELASIVAKKDELIVATDAYTEHEQALIKATAAGVTATSVTTTLAERIDSLGSAASLTQEDLEKLTKAILDNSQMGQQAVQDYATTYSEFISGVDQRAKEHKEKITELEAEKQKATTAEQKKGIDEQIKQVNQSYRDQETAAANSYAAQQAQQKQHLGQMLIDYTVARAEMGQIEKSKAAEITDALIKEYGLQENQVASTYLRMTDSIDQFAADAGGDIDALIGDLRSQQDQAAETQKAMDDYAKEYVATQTNNFLEGKTDADEYRRAIEAIPSRKEVTVTTRYETGGESNSDPSGGAGRRASGGPVDAMQPYLVGEEGPEYFIPDRSGTILSAPETRRAQASAAQLGGMMNTTNNRPVTNLYLTIEGNGVTHGEVVNAVREGLTMEGRSADMRIRMGG